MLGCVCVTSADIFVLEGFELLLGAEFVGLSRRQYFVQHERQAKAYHFSDASLYREAVTSERVVLLEVREPCKDLALPPPTVGNSHWQKLNSLVSRHHFTAHFLNINHHLRPLLLHLLYYWNMLETFF